MSVQNGDKPVDAVDVETTWQSLVSSPGAQLIDVRTRAEWTYVGIPDLGPIGKRAVLVEWQTFPDQTVDPRFVERLASELRALGAQLNDDLFFICRSGGRSLAAAKAMAEAGYRACHNVAGGSADSIGGGQTHDHSCDHCWGPDVERRGNAINRSRRFTRWD